ncbi:MAG: hypothetical protein ACIAQZ_05080 [Sedimentisphaeraceae bacterium JB056]
MKILINIGFGLFVFLFLLGLGNSKLLTPASILGGSSLIALAIHNKK